MQFAIPPPAERRTELRPKYVHLVWLPIASFVLAELLIGSFAQPMKVDVQVHANLNDSQWSEAAARIQFLALMFLYTLCCLAVIYKFLCDLVLLFDMPTRIQVLKVYVPLVVAAIIMVGLAHLQVLPAVIDLLGSDTFHAAFKKAANFEKVAEYRNQGFWSESAFHDMVWAATIASGLAVPSLVAGSISCLARFHRIEEKENWVYQSDRLKTYIYLGAGLLVIGVIYVKSWTQYPEFLLDEEALAKYSAVVGAFSVWTGIEFTVILSSFAIPIALILSERADHIAARIVKEEERLEAAPHVLPFNEKVMAVRRRENLMVTAQDVLKTVVALLAPLITGAIHNLSSVLG